MAGVRPEGASGKMVVLDGNRHLLREIELLGPSPCGWGGASGKLLALGPILGGRVRELEGNWETVSSWAPFLGQQGRELQGNWETVSFCAPFLGHGREFQGNWETVSLYPILGAGEGASGLCVLAHCSSRYFDALGFFGLLCPFE